MAVYLAQPQTEYFPNVEFDLAFNPEGGVLSLPKQVKRF